MRACVYEFNVLCAVCVLCEAGKKVCLILNPPRNNSAHQPPSFLRFTVSLIKQLAYTCYIHTSRNGEFPRIATNIQACLILQKSRGQRIQPAVGSVLCVAIAVISRVISVWIQFAPLFVVHNKWGGASVHVLLFFVPACGQLLQVLHVSSRFGVHSMTGCL